MLTPFEQPGPGARSGKCYRRRGLRLTRLQYLIFNRGIIQLFLEEFSLGCGGGGAGRVEGELSLMTGCFLSGPKVFFLRNTANSVFSIGLNILV